MSRRAPITSVSPQMLRHFAVATIAIMAVLILFAGGEVGQMREAEALKQRMKIEAAERAASDKMRAQIAKVDPTRSLYILPENNPNSVPIGDENVSTPGASPETTVPQGAGPRSASGLPTKVGTVMRIEDFGNNPIPGPPGVKRKPKPAKPKPPPTPPSGEFGVELKPGETAVSG